MPTKHVVKQGEYLSQIARDYGFASYLTLWNYADNAELKKKRKHPNILYPGDMVVIPDRGERVEARSTDKKHTFQARQETLRLRLQIENTYSEPVSGTDCILSVDSKELSTTSDEDGTVEWKIPRGATEAVLLVKERLKIKGTAVAVWYQVPVHVGHLDPVEEASGQMARLANLGYYRLPGEEIDDDEFRSAVEEFQCDCQLSVDGIIGPKTQAKLKEVHGC